MRFFTRMTERRPNDPQERAALLRHRLSAIEYKRSLLDDGTLAYAFFTADAFEAILMYEVDGHERLDLLIKRDPHFAYCDVEVIPTVSTEALVREAQGYLGEEIFTEAELPTLRFAKRQVDPDASYWLAWKECPPFSPLLSQEAQNDIFRRTVLSQKAHFEDFEFADDNPVGRAVGILIAEAPIERVRAHVERCEVFPDTVVKYSELLTLPRAWERTAAQLRDLRRPVPSESPFRPRRS